MRDLYTLDVDTRRKVIAMMTLLSARLPVYDEAHIVQTARDPSEQLAAFATGHSRARPGHSWHECSPARAADVMIFRHGKPVNNGEDPSYRILGDAAIEVGLCWGGMWTHKPDWDHVEDHPPGLGCRDAAKFIAQRPEVA